MKRLSLLLALSITGLFIQCSKADDKVFVTNFYTTTSTGKTFLYLDGVYQGQLIILEEKPECGADYGDGPHPISLSLPAGEHSVVGKNEQGQVISSAVVTLGAKKMGVSGNLGGTRLDENGDCVAINVYE